MHLIITIVAIATLFTGILYTSQIKNSDNQSGENEEVLSISQENNEENTSLPEPTLTIFPTNPPLSPTPKNLPTAKPDFIDYRYPSSEILSESSSEISFSSSDSVDSITQWYKDKIKGSGMNVKTFVTTKTNDKVENVLVGSNYEIEIRVEIKKEPSHDNVTISLTKSSL
ncbi:hypothetical protein A2962_03755 [Candidatus Woesebacteria bacterium RIFCSPLOWO2_01_FULL_39_61]|uniref:Uncharacterized protein n=1 Tax=Candidatus Woesebacteria bacterium RIFCSPHIGHO2_02_FULL_39_13 TaxID=1802505 RepID=A0A1F7Z2D1_9BACT|nr:MAG: hypothetical protein A2692_03935 [Candidatus Woesebacteria bacterium RIFCSPHIGHO2_01_FULL_39_95]OGM33806.1 MAG: hypothetical protein A3D01_02445 [Candidatus Woesebacteria bacterium RIFCSPHIGHO2_02_FULL_39_13]OGM38967.1 MAG: hypothetical protein A3E13_04715 [Candidatus Woesebacteria bacterium RIFCSPHIGHO2_12_FULL_40_20]OGM65615.1 MAG: hypothetical protein A2962_03755 [Candidatus Woesebacteria bacterium RIFCSPLOWO2_01_FULL_39_61]